MKPLAGYVGYNSEWRELAQVISRVWILEYNIIQRFFDFLKFQGYIHE
jgi:hypothetical protein